MHTFCVEKDNLCIKNSQRKVKAASLKARRAKRRRRLVLDEEQTQREDQSYLPGGY
jgi:hypothetical protein